MAGVAGGVGTTSVAAALGAADGGVFRMGYPVDVLVCRDTVVSLGSAHRLVNAAVGKPLLVIVASTPQATPRAATARIEFVRPHVHSVHTVPFVGRWREVTDPWSQAGGVARFPDQVPKWLRAFSQQIHEIHQPLVERLRASPADPRVPADARVPAAPSELPTAFPYP